MLHSLHDFRLIFATYIAIDAATASAKAMISELKAVESITVHECTF